jgi:hypothetical protein
MNRRAYETVARKRACEGPPGPAEAELESQLGSKGWHTRGYLPHYDKPGTLQMLTLRLADAMSAERRHEWEALLCIENERERRTKLEYPRRGAFPKGAAVYRVEPREGRLGEPGGGVAMEQRECEMALGRSEPLIRCAVGAASRAAWRSADIPIRRNVGRAAEEGERGFGARTVLSGAGGM